MTKSYTPSKNPKDCADNKMCNTTMIKPCCYYCIYITECFENWKKQKHYCRIEKTDRWCSKVRNYIRKHGFPKSSIVLPEKVTFT